MSESRVNIDAVEARITPQGARSPLEALGIPTPQFRPENDDVPSPRPDALLRLIYKDQLPEQGRLSEVDETRIRRWIVTFRSWCSVYGDLMSREYLRTGGMFDTLPDELRPEDAAGP